MKLLLLLTLLTSSLVCLGQTSNVWYFGDGNFLDFNTPTPTVTGNGTSNPAIVACNWSTAAGASMMCDNTGQLLFYSDGASVWDANYNLMPNGTGLFATGGQTYTASQSIVVPNPAGNDIYYLFHTDISAGNNGLRYTEIDMNLNGGNGDVTANKNVLLHANTDQRLKAITHCNGQDIWVISHDATGNAFKAYLVTAAGVSNVPVVSNVGVSLTAPWFGGYMACSKDGTRIAIAGDFQGANPWPDFIIELFYFDNQTGNLCNPIMFETSSDTGGIEFSADGTKLYVCEGELEQYDISSNVPATIEASVYDIGGAFSPGISSIMRGPDDKIYVTTSCQWSNQPTAMHVINDPNLTGAAINYQLNFIPVLPRTTGNLPTFYTPTQTTNTCGPVMTASASVSTNTLCIGDCITYTNSSVGSIVSYDWDFQGGTPATFSGANPPQVCYANTGNFATTLTVTDCAGNTSQTVINVDVLNCTGPQVNFNANQTQLCANDCTPFTDLSVGTNVNTWSWTFPGGTPATSTDQNPANICYSAPGSYDVTLTVTDDFGTNTLTMPNYIVVDPCIPPVTNFNAPDTICEGDCLDFLDASINTPTQWDWTFNGAVTPNSTNQNPQSICFQTPGTFTIELTSSNIYGQDTYSKDIVVLSTPDAGPDVALVWCETEVPQDLEPLLTPGIPTNGTWVNPQNTPAFLGTTFSPQVAGGGLYTIQYVLTNDICADTMEFNIEIQSPPHAGLDGVLDICDDDAAVDLMNILQGSPDLNGTWTPVMNSGNSFFNPSVDPSGVYTYIVQPATACNADSAKATVTVTYIPNLEITPVNGLCVSTPAFDLEANVNGGTWSGIAIIDELLGTYDPSVSGTGTYTITYEVETNNCSATTSVDLIVEDMPYVELGADFVNCINEPVQLTVETDPDNEIIWWNGSTDDIVYLDFENNHPNEQVSAEVTVSNTCGTASDMILITLEDCDVYVYVPNTFTPDGDEFNQVFTPVVTGENITDYQFQIFNRWGELVFQSADLNTGWDGTYKGRLQLDGTYTWTMRFTNYKGDERDVQTYNGFVTLVK